jgi:four helix bundle protein
MDSTKKITNFTDLNAWVEGHRLVLLIYGSSDIFPVNEKYGLCSQINRAVVSITCNIAEGFSRKSAKDKANFYQMAGASLTEVQNLLIITKDLAYLSTQDYDKLWQQTIIVQKLINGLIKYVSRNPHNT